MDVKEISVRRYAKLAGVLGGTIVRRDQRGTSWMLDNGTLVTEMATRDGWIRYLVTT